MKAVHTIDHVVNTILRWIVMIMLSVMSVIVFAQVVFRIVHLSIPWSENFQNIFCLSTFMGAALCVRKGSLVGLEFLQSALPERGQKALKIVLSIIICAMLVFLIGVGFWAVRRVCFQITPVLKQSMGLMYAAIPVGSVFMLINQIITTIYLIKGDEEA